jgi:hypothetical protein
MVLNFIIDAQDRVWLLWCEQLRCLPAEQDDAEAEESPSDSPLATPTGFSKAPRSGWDQVKEEDTGHMRQDQGEDQHPSDVGPSDSDEEARGPRAVRGGGGGVKYHGVSTTVLTFDSRGSTGKPENVGGGGNERGGAGGRAGKGEEEVFVLLMPESKTAPSKGGSKASSKNSSRVSSAASNASGTRSAAARGGAATGAANEKQRRELEAAEHRAALILEKKKREDAEKKALEVEEKLRKAETKAKAADARQRRLQKESMREGAVHRHKSPAARAGSTDRATSLGDGAGVEAGGVDTLLPPLPSAKYAAATVGDAGAERRGGGGERFLNAQQAALVDLVDEERGGQAEDLRRSSSMMANAVAAAAAVASDEFRGVPSEDTRGVDEEVAQKGEKQVERGARGAPGNADKELVDTGHAATAAIQDDTQSVAEGGGGGRGGAGGGGGGGEAAAEAAAAALGAASPTDPSARGVEHTQLPAAASPRRAHTGAQPSSSSESLDARLLETTAGRAEPSVRESATPPVRVPQQEREWAQHRALSGPSALGGASRSGYDNEQDYEDRPIGSIVALNAPAPAPPVATQHGAEPSFSVHVTQPGGADTNATDTSAGFRGREWKTGGDLLVDETRAAKPGLYGVSSPWQPAAGVQLPPERLAGEGGGPSRGEKQQLGLPHPQGMIHAHADTHTHTHTQHNTRKQTHI